MKVIAVEDIEICQLQANLNPRLAKLPECPAPYRVNR